jgi:hypothetical protein
LAVPVFEKIKEDQIIDLMKKAGMPVNGKAKLYDGRTGIPYENPVVVGIEYIMKLIHMVEDKTHASSVLVHTRLLPNSHLAEKHKWVDKDLEKWKSGHLNHTEHDIFYKKC